MREIMWRFGVCLRRVQAKEKQRIMVKEGKLSLLLQFTLQSARITLICFNVKSNESNQTFKIRIEERSTLFFLLFSYLLSLTSKHFI